ncbi:phage-like protein [Enterobacter hormaechei subsp. steigerwaltii]|uniref:phage-like protein n=1 Tax=Enterobacter hormaechei TaxID=158836 RepID=UPI0005EF374D|nr:phage-like protein [Enterobacter hormaechei]KJN69201.1 phage-like protein [Enterobacter hormaechei subsp. steigerwaltii]
MIFNGEMVRAILDGRKTQTRRIMKNQPAGDYPDTPALIRSVDGGFQWYGHYGESSIFNCPFGAVGDRIWVRETWADAGASAPDLKLYRANYPAHVPTHYENVPPASDIRWTPSIHMPRWASRITLEIAGVRVERLNDISECDAKAEGAPTECCVIGDKHFLGFRSLWKSIYGDESWRSNPLVWVIEFKVVPNVPANSTGSDLR